MNRIDHTTAHTFLDPADAISTTGGSIGLLVLNYQGLAREADHEALEAARDNYRQALADEVGQMHRAADQVFWGAVTQGAMAVVGGAASVYGSVKTSGAIADALESKNDLALSVALKPALAETLGSGVTTLAAPVGKVVSRSDGQGALADAKQASGRGEAAKWEIEDSNKHLDQSRQESERSTQWVASLVEKDDAATTSVLRNFA